MSSEIKRNNARKAVDDLDVSENNSFSASIYDNLQNSLNNSSLFLEQDGGKVKKTRKTGSKKRRSTSVERPKKGSKKAGSKKAGSKKSKSKKRSISMEGGKKGSKKASSKKRRSKKRSISMERPKKGSKKSGSKKGSKRAGSKRAGSKVKRALPEKLQEFQKLVKHMKSVTGEHSKFLFTLAKQIREEITKSNPNISTSDLTKKAMKYVDDNKSKVVSRYNDLKKK